MKLEEIGQREQKQRIVQELVPGKQITLAHIIANPDGELYEKLGLDPRVELSRAAIGIMTVSPSETAIIMADLAVKSSGVALGFVEIMTVAFMPELSGFRDAFAFILLVLVLVFKPTGLLGERMEEKI